MWAGQTVTETQEVWSQQTFPTCLSGLITRVEPLTFPLVGGTAVDQLGVNQSKLDVLCQRPSRKWILSFFTLVILVLPLSRVRSVSSHHVIVTDVPTRKNGVLRAVSALDRRVQHVMDDDAASVTLQAEDRAAAELCLFVLLHYLWKNVM